MLRNYLKIAFRNLWRNRSFTLINITGLTLGITCAIALFMIVRHELSFDTFHKDYKQIYRIVGEYKYEEGIEYTPGTPLPLAKAFRLDFPEVKKVATIMGGVNNQIDILDEKGNAGPEWRFKENRGVFYTSPEFFEIFNFKWLYGNPAEVMATPNAVALTKETAEKYFGSWQQAIGKLIKKDNEQVLKVAGILENQPVNTSLPLKVVISYSTYAASSAYRQLNSWGSVSSRNQIYVQIPANLPVKQLASRMPAFIQKYEKNNTTDYFSFQPLDDLHFNERFGNFGQRPISKSVIGSLALIGAFLLLLACINFINLATAQAIKRSREVGIRKVLGSLHWQLALQFLGETLLLVVLSTVLALGIVTMLSPLATELFNRSMPLQPFQSPVTLAFTAGIILFTTLLSGFYPALIISGFRPIEALKNKITSRAVGGISLRRFLVTSQFVIAQVLIIGTLIIITQISFFQNVSLGFNKDALLTVSLPRDSISKTKWDAFRLQLLQQPGIEQVSLSYTAPASGSNSSSTFRFNQTLKDEKFELNTKMADASYLKTYNLKLVAGRFYEQSDTVREFVVNETFLKKVGIVNPQEALGKYILWDDIKVPVVGVVKDFFPNSLRDPIDPIGMASSKTTYRIAGIKLKPAAIAATMPQIEKIFNNTFPEYLYEHEFLDETISGFYDQEQRLSHIFKVFAFIGIFISCIGLYGLILYMAIQRTREVGIRKVLGASAGNIVLLFIREFLWLIGIAFIIASPLAWYFMHQWLQDFAYRITISWWIFVITGGSALLIALATIGFQTIKTALANPVKSLRSE